MTHSKVIILKMPALASGVISASSTDAFGGGGVLLDVNGTRNSLQSSQSTNRRVSGTFSLF